MNCIRYNSIITYITVFNLEERFEALKSNKRVLIAELKDDVMRNLVQQINELNTLKVYDQN